MWKILIWYTGILKSLNRKNCMLFFLIFVNCLTFENNFSIDKDGDGYSLYDGDCDDNNYSISIEECTDNDGDGQDEYNGDCDDTDPTVFLDNPLIKGNGCYIDRDGDGYGDINPINPNIDSGTDCDDSDPHTRPEIANNEENSESCMTDSDGDGFGDMYPASESIEIGTDCDDDNEFVNPEVQWYKDSDGDSFGSDDFEGIVSCETLDNHVTNRDDQMMRIIQFHWGHRTLWRTINNCGTAFTRGRTRSWWG